MDSDTDSDRGKSSDPNEGLLSSDDKSFHDDEDEEEEDSSPADDEQEPEEESLLPQKKLPRPEEDRPAPLVFVQPSEEAIQVPQEIDEPAGGMVKEKEDPLELEFQVQPPDPQPEPEPEVVEPELEAKPPKCPSSLRDSVRESIECFYSAQDLLEYGHMLSSTSMVRTPDVESGYFEKSESDASRDEWEGPSSSSSGGAARCRLLSGISGISGLSASSSSRNSAEGLRMELSRFRAMIETLERESLEKSQSDQQLKVKAKPKPRQRTHLLESAGDSGSEQGSERGFWSTVFGQAGLGASQDEDERLADIQSTQGGLGQ